MFFMGENSRYKFTNASIVHIVQGIPHELIHMTPKDYKPWPTIEYINAKNCSL